jgi:predicted HAD superfamily Cof-like phosphohydrolase
VTNFDKVREFHETFGADINKPVKAGDEAYKALCELRCALIDEEYHEELQPAMEAGDIVEMADALADILYVTYGCAVAFGIPIDECFAEVHRSNMSKTGPDGKALRREDGKILKGPNYFRPNLAAILRKYGKIS